MPKTVMPDQLSIDPKSPFYNKALLDRGVAVGFKDRDRDNVAEYCVSEGWVRLIVGAARGRDGQPLTVKMQGPVRVWMKAEGQ